MTPFQYNDGGRAAAGFRGAADDCACRAAAIATGRPYAEVYKALNLLGKKPGRKYRSNARTGVWPDTMKDYMHSLGWTWVPTMTIGSGCKIHLRGSELPPGRIVVRVSKHYVAVVNGVIHDTHDSSRGGNRCVYGYFLKGP